MREWSKRSISWRIVGCASFLLALSLISGSVGCERWNRFRSDPEKQDEKNEKSDQPRFSFDPIRFFPNDHTIVEAHPVKPGHLTEAIWGARSNRDDARGHFEMSATSRDTGARIAIPGTRFYLTQRREVVLPKGQDKQLRVWYPLPSPRSTTFALDYRFVSDRGNRDENAAQDFVIPMPAHQFFLVVLAADPDRFTFVKQLNATRQPAFEFAAQETDVYYQVSLPAANEPLPLPHATLAWTPIAYVLWDEMSPDRLQATQRESLVDWLHWGGQLIISGPGSLDLLKGSFLEPYLPATAGSSRQLSQSDFDPLNRRWGMAEAGQKERHEVQVLADNPLAGITLKLQSSGRFIEGTGELVAERRVGRGRITVTAFPIEARPLVSWMGYDGFFNGCLMRKPVRAFKKLDAVQPIWEFIDYDMDPVLLHSAMRFFVRDIGPKIAKRIHTGDQIPWQVAQAESPPTDNIAGWNDANAVTMEAEDSLTIASGITVPNRRFVWKSLGIYLMILVPLNWAFFRLIRRVEWAWLAIPVISLLGAWWIVHAAQLNIGFARSRTELAILELHADYRHAHLSRFISLYTSLSTPFELTFEQDHAVAQPFAGKTNARIDQHHTVELQNGSKTTLSGFQVNSNSTAMIHSEEFTDLGGVLSVSNESSIPELRNLSRHLLQGVGVIRRTEDGLLEGAWIGRLPPQQSEPLEFHALDVDAPWLEPWDRQPLSRKAPTSLTDPPLRNLIRTACHNLILRPGDMRFIGWIKGTISGLEITPKISQIRGVTLVLGHLKYGPIPIPQPDKNLLADVTVSPSPDSDPQLETNPQ